METIQSEIICRACLSDNSESYFDINERCDETKTFKDLIESLTSFVVERDEPSFVCQTCAFQLEESFKFKQTLEETQLIIGRMKIVEEEEELLEDGPILVELDENMKNNEVESGIVYEEIEVEENGMLKKENFGQIQKEEEEMVDELIEEVQEKYSTDTIEMSVYDLSNCVVEVIDKDFACMYCSKQFAKERGLFDHLNRYHRDKKTIECKLCHRCFYSNDHRDSHTPRCPALIKPKSDQILQCPECGRIGGQKVIRNHILNVHRKKREGPFQCDMCKIWLKSKECVANHMKAKHLHRKFPCKYCDKYYSSRSGRDQHVQQYHTKDTTYNCPLCSYNTHSKTLLRKHVLRHTSTTTFNCELCNSAFVSLDNLRRHQFVHTDARPCVCTTCNRSFKNKEALKKHQAIHQEYRYECPMCVRKYLTNQAMRNHCAKNHPDYTLPPLGTILAADARLKQTTDINAKLQKTILMPLQTQDDVFGLINYDGDD